MAHDPKYPTVNTRCIAVSSSLKILLTAYGIGLPHPRNMWHS